MTTPPSDTPTLSEALRAKRLVPPRMNPARARGSIYLAALGLSLLIATVGVAAVALARTGTRTLNLQSDAARADLLARSAADLALRRLGQIPDWQAAHNPGAWTDIEGSNGSMRYMLDNPDGGGLADSPFTRVTLHARGTSGQAVRQYAVELLPRTGNLLDNPAFSPSLSPWSTSGGETTLTPATDANVGTYLTVANRSQWQHGPQQALTGQLAEGQPLFFEIYIRLPTGSAPVKATIHTRALLLLIVTNLYHGDQTPGVGTAWTRVTGTMTPNWSGSLQLARFYIETPGSTTPFDLAQPLLRPAYQIPPTAPGTWRQELP